MWEQELVVGFYAKLIWLHDKIILKGGRNVKTMVSKDVFQKGNIVGKYSYRIEELTLSLWQDRKFLHDGK